MKSRLVEALDAKLSEDSQGENSLRWLLDEPSENLRGKVNHIAEWKPETHYRSPFVGIQVFNTSQLNPLTQIFRSIINLRCYSTDQLKTSLIADRIQQLLTVDTGEGNRFYFDFSSTNVRVLNCDFLQRYQGEWSENLDSYEEIVSMSVIWTPVLCDREFSSIELCQVPPLEDNSPSGHNC